MKQYFEIIRALREDRDLKQADVAKVIHTSQQQYSKYETAYAEIPLRVLLELADFYGVSTDYLLGRVPYAANVQALETFLSQNDAVAAMLSSLQKLSPESQTSVFEYVTLQTLKEKIHE